MVESRERKICPNCKSVQISSVHSKHAVKSVPDQFRLKKHYKCKQCNHRFFNPVVVGFHDTTPQVSHVDYELIKKYHTLEYNDSEIKEATGYCKNTIMGWRHSGGLEAGYGYERRNTECNIKKMHDLGYCEREIANELECSTSRVWRWKLRNGLVCPRKPKE
jgi:transposase-like protein